MDAQAIITRLAVTGISYFVSDIFIHGAVKSAFKKNSKLALRRYWMINITVFVVATLGFVLLQYMQPTMARINLWFFGIFISLLFSKLIIAVLLLVFEDIYRIPYSLITYRKRKKEYLDKRIIISRLYVYFTIGFICSSPSF